MKKSIILCTLLAFAFTCVEAQGTLRDALAQIKSQGTYSTLIYYGADFSHVIVNDAQKIPRSVKYSQVYPAAWVAFVEKELPPDGFVRSALGFPEFSYRQQEIFENSIAANPDLITGHDNTISAETIKSMISAYKLEAKSGLGLVLIPETFSKPTETATTWVVFFDVGSREILYKTKVYGKCSHMGYTAHWASGVVEGFKYFLNH
ncbi:MAG: hypothetical protein IH596_08945 [Bacteroidales bacterium]|nr:hypothetical protein [Bacteroidales bacterium]